MTIVDTNDRLFANKIVDDRPTIVAIGRYRRFLFRKWNCAVVNRRRSSILMSIFYFQQLAAFLRSSTLRQRLYVKSSTIVDFTFVHTSVDARTSTPRTGTLVAISKLLSRGVDVSALTIVCMEVKSTIVDDFT